MGWRSVLVGESGTDSAVYKRRLIPPPSQQSAPAVQSTSVPALSEVGPLLVPGVASSVGVGVDEVPGRIDALGGLTQAHRDLLHSRWRELVGGVGGEAGLVGLLADLDRHEAAARALGSGGQRAGQRLDQLFGFTEVSAYQVGCWRGWTGLLVVRPRWRAWVGWRGGSGVGEVSGRGGWVAASLMVVCGCGIG